MSQRWDVLTVKDRGENQKPWFTKIGSAWESEKGNGNITIILDALPIDGKLILSLPQEQDRQQGERGQFRGQRGGGQSQGGGGGQRGGGRQQGGQRGGGGQQRQSNQQRYAQRGQSEPRRASEADFNQGAPPADEFFDGDGDSDAGGDYGEQYNKGQGDFQF